MFSCALYQEVFFRPRLARFWLSQVTSAIGDQLYNIAVIWIAVEQGQGNAGLVAAAGTLVGLLLNPIAGVLADRWNRHLTMIVADLSRAVIVLALAIFGQYGNLTLWHLAVASMIVATLSCVFNPSMTATMPELAEDNLDILRALNALMQLNRQLARTIGPGVAGWLCSIIPLNQFFTIDAITFLVSAAAIYSVSNNTLSLVKFFGLNHQCDASSKIAINFLKELRLGLSLVWNHKELRWIFLFMGLCNFAYGPGIILGFPLWAKQYAHSGMATYGTLIAFYGIGGCLNFFVAMFHSSRLMFWYSFGWFLFGFGLFLLGRATQLPSACFAAIIIPVGTAFMGMMASIAVQTSIPREHLGKVSSLMTFVVCFGDLSGLLIAPCLFSHLDSSKGISICSLIPLLIGFIGMLKFHNSIFVLAKNPEV